MWCVSVVVSRGQRGCGPSLCSWFMGDGYDELLGGMDEDVDMCGEDDVDEAMYPRVNLTDVFDRLADAPVVPVASECLSGGPGWACGDLGGDGASPGRGATSFLSSRHPAAVARVLAPGPEASLTPTERHLRF